MKSRKLKKTFLASIGVAALFIPVVATTAVACSSEDVKKVFTPSVPTISISTQPQNQTVIIGQKQNLPFFSVKATSSNSNTKLTYQWYSNTVDSIQGATLINGATDSSYSVSQSEIQNVGTTYFYVQISGVLGNDSLNAIVSNISTLTVSPVPIIIVNVEPLNQSVQMNQKTNLPTFSVNAQSNNSKAVLSYQWYSNTTNSTLGAVAINNATNSSYTVPSTDALTIGTKYFFVKISGTVEGIKMNSLNSHIASLNVDVSHLIKITTQPISQTVIVGQTQNLPTLSITASTINDANLTYQWYSNTIYSTIRSNTSSKWNQFITCLFFWGY